MERFKLLTIFAKHSILAIWQGFEYASVFDVITLHIHITKNPIGKETTATLTIPLQYL